MTHARGCFAGATACAAVGVGLGADWVVVLPVAAAIAVVVAVVPPVVVAVHLDAGAGAEAGGLLDSAAAAGCAPPPPTASRAVCCGPEAGYSCSEAGQRGAGRGRVDVKVYTSALLAVAADIRGRAAAEAALERAGGVLKHAKALGPAPAPAPAPARAAGSAGPPRVTAAPFDFLESNGSKQV